MPRERLGKVTSMEKGHSPVQSIDRLFDIVEALSNAPRGMALSDLSAAVGLHTSTTHRLLAALVARGYVQKDIESGKYRLTMRLFEVGSRAVGGMNIVSLARPYLEHLAATTHEAIHLVVRDGDRGRVPLQREYGRQHGAHGVVCGAAQPDVLHGGGQKHFILPAGGGGHGHLAADGHHSLHAAHHCRLRGSDRRAGQGPAERLGPPTARSMSWASAALPRRCWTFTARRSGRSVCPCRQRV